MRAANIREERKEPLFRAAPSGEQANPPRAVASMSGTWCGAAPCGLRAGDGDSYKPVVLGVVMPGHRCAISIRPPLIR
jgi:hypothetical protein